MRDEKIASLLRNTSVCELVFFFFLFLLYSYTTAHAQAEANSASSVESVAGGNIGPFEFSLKEPAYLIPSLPPHTLAFLEVGCESDMAV